MILHKIKTGTCIWLTVLIAKKILIIPCSGIGKPYGTVSREAAFNVCGRIDDADTDCLAAIVIEDKEVLDRLAEASAIHTIDGCYNKCSRKTIEKAGFKVKEPFGVWKFHQENKDLKPRAVTFLDEDGKELSVRLADRICRRVKGGGD